MIITPNGYELVHEKRPDHSNTVEEAISKGFEKALDEKGRDIDYEFTIETRGGVKYVYCEIKLDNGYVMRTHHEDGEHVDLSEVQRKSYQFLSERL